MAEFKVGDRVITARGVFAGLRVDCPGVVIAVASPQRIGVEFDYAIPQGHDCAGRGKPGYCRWGSSNELELYQDIPDERPKEFFYKSRKLSRFLSEFKAAKTEVNI